MLVIFLTSVFSCCCFFCFFFFFCYSVINKDSYVSSFPSAHGYPLRERKTELQHLSRLSILTGWLQWPRVDCESAAVEKLERKTRISSRKWSWGRIINHTNWPYCLRCSLLSLRFYLLCSSVSFLSLPLSLTVDFSSKLCKRLQHDSSLFILTDNCKKRQDTSVLDIRKASFSCLKRKRNFSLFSFIHISKMNADWTNAPRMSNIYAHRRGMTMSFECAHALYSRCKWYVGKEASTLEK